MRRPSCTFLGCQSPSIWTDVDTGRVYCGAHAVIEMMRMDEEEADRADRRRDIGDEWARDAAREARS